MNPTAKRKARILVVDDDPGLLRLLTIRLRAENYEVEPKLWHFIIHLLKHWKR